MKTSTLKAPTIVHGESSRSFVLPTTQMRGPWTVEASSSVRRNLAIKVYIGERVRHHESDRTKPGMIFINASMGISDDAELGDANLIDGIWLRADAAETFARTLLAAIENTKAEHPDHWHPYRGPTLTEFDRE